MENFKILFPTSLVLIYLKYNSFKTKEADSQKNCIENKQIFVVASYRLPDVVNGIIDFNCCLN